MRWLRAGWRHGYALISIFNGAAVLVFGLLSGLGRPTVRGTFLVDGLTYLMFALFAGLLTYGLLRLVRALYGAGILRG